MFHRFCHYQVICGVQRERRVTHAVGNPRHYPWHGDLGTVGAAPTDCRDWEADQGAVAADGHDDSDREQTRRRDHHVDDEQLRVTDIRFQDGVARASHLGNQPSPPYQPHLRLLWRHQGNWIHVHSAQEHSEEVHHHLWSSSTGQYWVLDAAFVNGIWMFCRILCTSVYLLLIFVEFVAVLQNKDVTALLTHRET